MANGSFNLTRTGNTSRYITFTCNWSSTTDTANNCSNITVTVVASKSSSSTASTYGTQTTKVTVDGSSQSNGGAFSLRPNTTITLFSKNYKISHNSDGTKQTTIKVDVGGDVMWANGTSNITLDTIPRQAKIQSVTSSTLEGKDKIKFKSNGGSFYYKIWIEAKKPGDNSYKGIGTRFNYRSEQDITFSDDELKTIYNLFNLNITSSSTVDIKYHLQTYSSKNFSSNDYVGEDTKVVTETIKKAIARIDKVGNFNVEDEHWLRYTKFSNNFHYQIWIVAKKHGANDSKYVHIHNYDNYTSGQHVQFTQSEIKKIYNLANPDIKIDTYVDVMYHLQTRDENGNFIGEQTKVVQGRIKSAYATIDNIDTFRIEQEHSITYTKYSNFFWYNLWITARKSGTNDEYQHIQSFGDYDNGEKIQFSDASITKLYAIAMPDTNVGISLDIRYHLETWDKKGGNMLGTSNITKQEAIGGNIYIKNGGVWKKCVPFVNVRGSWKPCLSYMNVNKNWEKGVVE